MGISEAKINGNQFSFNGWFRWVVGGVVAALYALIIFWLTSLTSNVIANDKDSRDRNNTNTMMIMENRSDIKKTEAQYADIKEGIKRIERQIEYLNNKK